MHQLRIPLSLHRLHRVILRPFSARHLRPVHHVVGVLPARQPHIAEFFRPPLGLLSHLHLAPIGVLLRKDCLYPCRLFLMNLLSLLSFSLPGQSRSPLGWTDRRNGVLAIGSHTGTSINAMSSFSARTPLVSPPIFVVILHYIIVETEAAFTVYVLTAMLLDLTFTILHFKHYRLNFNQSPVWGKDNMDINIITQISHFTELCPVLACCRSLAYQLHLIPPHHLPCQTPF
jgi:hypothetical protein